MHADNDIVAALKIRQSQMRREMDRRGIALKGVSFDSGIPYSSLLSYFPDEHAKAIPALMPVSASYALCGVIPSDILSLLLPPGHVIVQVPENIDHDEIAAVVCDYLAEKERAHHPESEAGREIGPVEDASLRGKVANLRAVA